MLNIIKKIEQAVGNEKIEVMKAHPEIKQVLLYAYDPFKKYYMTAPDLEGSLAGNCFNATTELLFDELSERKISGQAAIDKVSQHIRYYDKNWAELFKMIINKDLRCGINVKSINKAFPGLIPLVYDGSTKPDIMLCKNYDGSDIYPCLGAVKKDGVRSRYVTGMVSRQGKKLIGHDHIEEQLFHFPYELDGELCVPGEIFDIASGMIRSNNPTPESVYYIFDAPSIPGGKLHRYTELLKLANEYNLESNSIKILHNFKIDSKETQKKFLKYALDQGEEGIVLYDPDGEYEDRRGWWRDVPLKQADCKVIDFFEGKGKHTGSLGGIVVDYKGKEVKVGTGFSEKILKSQEKQLLSIADKNMLYSKELKVSRDLLHKISPIWHNIRDFIWANKDLFMGVVAQCEFKEETKAGSMRQPRFKRWRWDKE